jgi:pentose-5-phosphate-3-epimerase
MAKQEKNFAVAENPAAPIDILKALSTNKDYSVRYEVAINPATPEDVLTVLVKDKDENVRAAVARR